MRAPSKSRRWQDYVANGTSIVGGADATSVRVVAAVMIFIGTIIAAGAVIGLVSGGGSWAGLVLALLGVPAWAVPVAIGVCVMAIALGLYKFVSSLSQKDKA
jgi:hypothetical protein